MLKFSVFHCWVWCLLWVFMYDLYYIRYILLNALYWVFIMKGVQFCQIFFLHLWDDFVAFVLHFVNVLPEIVLNRQIAKREGNISGFNLNHTALLSRCFVCSKLRNPRMRLTIRNFRCYHMMWKWWAKFPITIFFSFMNMCDLKDNPMALVLNW